MNFKEDGVNEIFKDVFIPWFNVYRFMLQNINRYEMDSGKKWMFNEELFSNLDGFKGLMDKWIISANQDLIKFVRKELEAYRLYTVVKEKVRFLGLLSNWYLRLNRDTLKGDFGLEESDIGLNVMFFVL